MHVLSLFKLFRRKLYKRLNTLSILKVVSLISLYRDITNHFFEYAITELTNI